MTIRVQLFAGAREAAGADYVEVTLDDRATFADLSAALLAASPRLRRC